MGNSSGTNNKPPVDVTDTETDTETEPDTEPETPTDTKPPETYPTEPGPLQATTTSTANKHYISVINSMTDENFTKFITSLHNLDQDCSYTFIFKDRKKFIGWTELEAKRRNFDTFISFGVCVVSNSAKNGTTYDLDLYRGKNATDNNMHILVKSPSSSTSGTDATVSSDVSSITPNFTSKDMSVSNYDPFVGAPYKSISGIEILVEMTYYLVNEEFKDIDDCYVISGQGGGFLSPDLPLLETLQHVHSPSQVCILLFVITTNNRPTSYTTPEYKYTENELAYLERYCQVYGYTKVQASSNDFIATVYYSQGTYEASKNILTFGNETISFTGGVSQNTIGLSCLNMNCNYKSIVSAVNGYTELPCYRSYISYNNLNRFRQMYLYRMLPISYTLSTLPSNELAVVLKGREDVYVGVMEQLAASYSGDLLLVMMNCSRDYTLDDYVVGMANTKGWTIYAVKNAISNNNYNNYLYKSSTFVANEDYSLCSIGKIGCYLESYTGTPGTYESSINAKTLDIQTGDGYTSGNESIIQPVADDVTVYNLWVGK